MSKSEKREQRIRDNTANVSLHEFEALILRYGEIVEGANHPKAHIGNHIFPYKRENPVKAHYVEAVLGFIDEAEEIQADGN
ncbi:MAG: hypothetical protein GX631_04760 [Dehalococcoidales bacterium]|nr:hypothetical protein [Dehalococcoidales bacterium]